MQSMWYANSDQIRSAQPNGEPRGVATGDLSRMESVVDSGVGIPVDAALAAVDRRRFCQGGSESGVQSTQQMIWLDSSLSSCSLHGQRPSGGRYLGFVVANQTLAVWVTCPDGGCHMIPDKPFFEPSVFALIVGRVFNVDISGAMNETVTICEGNSRIEDTWTFIPQCES